MLIHEMLHTPLEARFAFLNSGQDAAFFFGAEMFGNLFVRFCQPRSQANQRFWRTGRRCPWQLSQIIQDRRVDFLERFGGSLDSAWHLNSSKDNACLPDQCVSQPLAAAMTCSFIAGSDSLDGVRPGREAFTVTTGHGAFRVTASATLPMSTRPRPERPCVPITIMPHLTLLAARRISVAGSPSTKWCSRRMSGSWGCTVSSCRLS